MVRRLALASGEFADLWATGDVEDCTVGNMLLAHPVLGVLDVDYQVWLQPESVDHRLEVYTPNDAATRHAFRPRVRQDLGQAAAHGSMTANPTASNGSVSRVATANPVRAAVAAM